MGADWEKNADWCGPGKCMSVRYPENCQSTFWCHISGRKNFSTWHHGIHLNGAAATYALWLMSNSSKYMLPCFLTGEPADVAVFTFNMLAHLQSISIFSSVTCISDRYILVYAIISHLACLVTQVRSVKRGKIVLKN